MEKLMSMTAFVVHQNMRYANKEITIEQLQLSILNHAVFLQQPVKLSMFVTVMSNGIVPTSEEIKTFFNTPLFEEYQESKDRVLFDGFEIIKKKFNNSEYDYLSNGDIYVFSFWENKWQLNDLFKTVEDLIKFELVLTESAKKQILGL